MGRRAGSEGVAKGSYVLTLLQFIGFTGSLKIRRAKEGDWENSKDCQNLHQLL